MENKIRTECKSKILKVILERMEKSGEKQANQVFFIDDDHVDIKPFKDLLDQNEGFVLKEGKEDEQNNLKNRKHQKRIRKPELIQSCYVCDQLFRHKFSYENHLRRHLSEKPFTCRFKPCERDFVNKKMLNRHIKRMHSEVSHPFACPKPTCNSILTDSLSFQRHVAVCLKSEDFYCIKYTNEGKVKFYVCLKCPGSVTKIRRKDFIIDHIVREHLKLKLYFCQIPSCKSEFCTKSELGLHLRKVHGTEKPYPCPISGCGRRFGEKSYVTSHLKTAHTTERNEKCPQCDKMFKTKQAVMSHLKKLHTGEKYYSCDICHLSFTYEGTMTSHKRQHVTTSAFPVKCPKCHMRKRNEAVLNKHLTFCGNNDHYTVEKTDIPSGIPPSSRQANIWSCRHCSKTAERREYIEDHVFRNHLSLKFYKCTEPNCAMEFTHRTELASHNLQHSGAKPFKCDICNRRFTQKTPLNNHIVTAHKMEKLVQCPICPKMFPTSSQRRNHVRNAHVKERPNKCIDCGKDFPELGGLRRHQNRMHLNIKEFKCEEGGCGKGFVSQDELKRHSLCHSGEREFKCNKCKVCFKTRNKLERHYTSQYHVNGVRPGRGASRVTFYKEDSSSDDV